MKKPLPLQSYVAEAIGTFLLASAVGVSIAMPQVGIPTAIVAGLVLGTVVYTIGGISGAHINPAITLSLLSTGKINGRMALFYIISQLVGGFLAFIFQSHHFPINSLVTDGLNLPVVTFAEMLGAFILAWGVSSVVYNKVQPAASGITIGSSLTIGATIASFGSFGILNHAVAIGLGVFSPVYLLAPIVGAVVGAQAYRWTANEK